METYHPVNLSLKVFFGLSILLNTLICLTIQIQKQERSHWHQTLIFLLKYFDYKNQPMFIIEYIVKQKAENRT